MGTTKILLNSKPVVVHKATIAPSFNKKTVLVENPWEYIELWIKRNSSNQALFYWQQAHGFYQATQQLPKTSSPLTAYYCFLNATKALLEVKDVRYVNRHGVSGEQGGKQASLSNELIIFKHNGVLSELSRLLGETVNGEEYTFKQLIYNLSYVHRAYTLTYSTDPELFFPVSNPHFVKVKGQNYGFLTAEITSPYYQNKNTINKLPNTLERDMGNPDKYVIRKKKRFKWQRGAQHKRDNLNSLKKYHRAVRKDIHYIYGTSQLWYFKRGNVDNTIDKNFLTLTFALMHRLSELSRYDPIRLNKHFDNQHNWLLSEFVTNAPRQFVYGVASEISGEEFKVPGLRL